MAKPKFSFHVKSIEELNRYVVPQNEWSYEPKSVVYRPQYEGSTKYIVSVEIAVGKVIPHHVNKDEVFIVNEMEERKIFQFILSVDYKLTNGEVYPMFHYYDSEGGLMASREYDENKQTNNSECVSSDLYFVLMELGGLEYANVLLCKLLDDIEKSLNIFILEKGLR